jgi:DNA-binding protein YbaB
MVYRRTFTIHSLERTPSGVLVGIAAKGAERPLHVHLTPRHFHGDAERFEDLVLVAVTWLLRLLNRSMAGAADEREIEPEVELGLAG